MRLVGKKQASWDEEILWTVDEAVAWEDGSPLLPNLLPRFVFSLKLLSRDCPGIPLSLPPIWNLGLWYPPLPHSCLCRQMPRVFRGYVTLSRFKSEQYWVISIQLNTRFLEPDCQGSKPGSATLFLLLPSISSSIIWE